MEGGEPSLIELTGNYGVLRPMLQPLNHHLVVESVLAGQTPARIFVDRFSLPQSALIWAGHRIVLAGLPTQLVFNQAVRDILLNMIYPHAQAAGAGLLSLYHGPESWAEKITEFLQGKDQHSAAREYFTYVAGQPFDTNWRSRLPTKFQLRSVDAGLLADRRLAGLDDLKDEMCSERPSVDDFLAKSFGVCMTYGDELAGWCLSEYNVNLQCEVGVATMPPYQRRGLATIMTCALIEEALSRNMIKIGWHCWRDNVASAATARKAGFTKQLEYSIYYSWYDKLYPPTAIGGPAFTAPGG